MSARIAARHSQIAHIATTMATSSVLYAAAKEIGATCDAENRAFLKCKSVDEDPAACLDKGEAVQACALSVLRSAMATCEQTFQSYASCLENQISQEYMFERCRKQENAFAECRNKAKSSQSVVAAAPSETDNRKDAPHKAA